MTGCAEWRNDAAQLFWAWDGAAPTGGSFNAQVLPGATVNLLFSGNGGPARAPFTCTLTGSCLLDKGTLQNTAGLYTSGFTATITTTCIYAKLGSLALTGNPSEYAEGEVVYYAGVTRPTPAER